MKKLRKHLNFYKKKIKNTFKNNQDLKGLGFFVLNEYISKNINKV